MTYPKDLDEYDDEALQGELNRRREALARGICPYCGRRGDILPACRQPALHAQAAAVVQNSPPAGGPFVENIAPREDP